ncbi:MAG TPA: LAGLIDADG family homing endonuclease [Candidatus Levybacteria bacterium]|nr:LAGLIDADG family homing endonuclease [Candidatus Levybacteria bacterium]
MDRFKFLPEEQKKFLNMVSSKSNLSTKALSKLVNVHPRTLSDWKKEKLTISSNAAKTFCKEFELMLPEDETVLVNRWIKARSNAAKIGGFARLKKYGSLATQAGRRKGGITSIANLRKNGIIPNVKNYTLPVNFTEDLAEFVGIMLGDGGITPNQCSITLNSLADIEYVTFISNLTQKLFGEKPKMYYKKDCNAIVLYYNGTSLISYLTQIGLKIGHKVRQQVDVPDWVNIYPLYRNACLRGLMDTDGGVFLHKYTVNGRKYIYRKISFSNRSLPLLSFVFNTLIEIGLTPKLVDKVENKKVWLYNNDEVKQYLQIVGTHNSRLLKYGG